MNDTVLEQLLTQVFASKFASIDESDIEVIITIIREGNGGDDGNRRRLLMPAAGDNDNRDVENEGKEEKHIVGIEFDVIIDEVTIGHDMKHVKQIEDVLEDALEDALEDVLEDASTESATQIEADELDMLDALETLKLEDASGESVSDLVTMVSSHATLLQTVAPSSQPTQLLSH